MDLCEKKIRTMSFFGDVESLSTTSEPAEEFEEVYGI